MRAGVVASGLHIPPPTIALLDYGEPNNGPPQGHLSWSSRDTQFWLHRGLPKYDADGHDLAPFFDGLVFGAGEQGLPVIAHRDDTGQEWLVRLRRTALFSNSLTTVSVEAPANFSQPAPAGTRWTFTYSQED